MLGKQKPNLPPPQPRILSTKLDRPQSLPCAVSIEPERRAPHKPPAEWPQRQRSPRPVASCAAGHRPPATNLERMGPPSSSPHPRGFQLHRGQPRSLPYQPPGLTHTHRCPLPAGGGQRAPPCDAEAGACPAGVAGAVGHSCFLETQENGHQGRGTQGRDSPSTAWGSSSSLVTVSGPPAHSPAAACAQDHRRWPPHQQPAGTPSTCAFGTDSEAPRAWLHPGHTQLPPP